MSSLFAAFLIASTSVASASEPTCPERDRPALLRDHPEKLLHCDGASEAVDRVWAAHALSALGRFGEAAALLMSVSKQVKSPVVKGVISITAAYDEARAGEPREAAKLLNGLSPKRRWLRAELSAARADLALLNHDWSLAERAAHDALAQHAPGRDALHLALARAAAGRHDTAALQDVLRTLELDFPDSSATRVAEALAGQTPELDASDLAQRWTTLIARGQAQTVTDECVARESSLPRDADGSRARFECAIAFATTHHASAGQMLHRVVDDLRSGKAAAHALLLLARLASHTNDAKAVRALCGQIDRSQADAAECWFLAAFVAQQSGHRDEARAAMAQVRDGFPRSPRARDAAWFLAFDTYEHDRESAVPAFDALLKGRSYGIDRAQLLYWRGRSRPTSQAAEARSDWEEVLRQDPFGYYGWLAAARLGLNADSAPNGMCEATAPVAATVPSGAADAALLLRAGFGRYATLELDEAMPQGARQRQQWLPFFRQIGQFERMVTVGVALGGQEGPWPAAEERSALIHAAFPQAFPEALASAPAGVDRCLLLSLMRRESRFNPDAISAAQAHGLMQLLPRTAASVAKDMGEEAPSSSDLHDPIVNVHVAGEYVRRLMLRFGHPLLVAAAYNGGPQNVAKWMNDNAGMDFDEWVERIPFRETRHYVKAVGGAYAAYALIYGGKRPPLNLDAVKPPPADGINY